MPPRAKPAIATTSHTTRVMKEKVRATIKDAIAPGFKAPDPHTRARTITEWIPTPTLPPVINMLEGGEFTSGNNDLSDHHESNDRSNLMSGIERMVHQTMSEVFTNQIEEGSCLATMEADSISRVRPDIGNNPSSLSSLLSPTATTAHHILAQWPWVGQETIDLISQGKFEIDNLPKLHQSDDLQNVYLKRSMKGIYQPLEGGPPEIIISTTKLQSSFKDPMTFF